MAGVSSASRHLINALRTPWGTSQVRCRASKCSLLCAHAPRAQSQTSQATAHPCFTTAQAASLGLRKGRQTQPEAAPQPVLYWVKRQLQSPPGSGASLCWWSRRSVSSIWARVTLLGADARGALPPLSLESSSSSRRCVSFLRSSCSRRRFSFSSCGGKG